MVLLAVPDSVQIVTTIRQAGPDDAEALVALRVLMFEAMGFEAARNPEWQQACADWFREALDRDDVAAFVAEEDGQGLVSAALGIVDRHVPSPNNPAVHSGHVSNVVTAPGFRGRGLARACLTALIDWFRTSTDVHDLNLSATADGQALYASLGFHVREYPSMRLTLP